MKKRTDKERIDAIQQLTTGYGDGWILRRSFSNRGMRLHETAGEGAVPNVRDAIDKYLEGREVEILQETAGEDAIEQIAEMKENEKRKKELSASEALFGFCGWLTGRDKITVMSAKHNAATIADLIARFIKVNKLSQPRERWEKKLKQPSNAY